MVGSRARGFCVVIRFEETDRRPPGLFGPESFLGDIEEVFIRGELRRELLETLERTDGVFGGSISTTLGDIRGDPAFRTVVPQVPTDSTLCTVVARCNAHSSNDRPPSNAEELLACIPNGECRGKESFNVHRIL